MIKRTALMPRRSYYKDAKLILVAVEGEKTEKQYLSIFESSRLHIEVLAATEGKSAPRQVLDRLAKSEEALELGPEDERWLMFDIDHHRTEFIAEVTQLAVDNAYNLAISNRCFELWLVLHFCDCPPEASRCSDIASSLRSQLGSYNKSNLDLTRYTRDRIENAITRAKQVAGHGSARWPDTQGTHVYKLIEKLMVLTVTGR